MAGVLETMGEEYTIRTPEDAEAWARGKVLETCDTAVAEEGDAKGRDEGEVRTVDSDQLSVVSGQDGPGASLRANTYLCDRKASSAATTPTLGICIRAWPQPCRKSLQNDSGLQPLLAFFCAK